MFRKVLLVGLLTVGLASCGQPNNPCPPAAPVGPQTLLDTGEIPVVMAGFRAGGGFRSSGSFRSSGGGFFGRKSGSTFNQPRFNTPAPKPSAPVYRTQRSTVIVNNGGGGNGFLWGLGGYLLGQHMAEDRCR